MEQAPNPARDGSAHDGSADDGPATTGLQPPSAAERAHVAIRAAIVRGEFPPGTMLSENDLAARLSMSRTPVRAALLRMQDEGLIAVYPKRGALVRDIGAAEARDLSDARYALETASVRRLGAAERAALAGRLRAEITRQTRTPAADVEAFIASDAAFHRGLVSAGGNAILLGFYDRLQDRQLLMLARGLRTSVSRAREVVREHRALATSVSDGAWDVFETQLADHLSHTRDAMFAAEL